MSNAINWHSPSGAVLTFGVYQHSDNWADLSGIYMFCRLEANGKSTPVYIGQAKSFKDRLPGHEQWEPAMRLGATTVHAALVPSQDARDQHEKELIHQFQPSLNTHHIGGLGLFGLGAQQALPSNGLLSSGIIGRAR